MLDGSPVGLTMQENFSYTWRDIVLYNLSVGAGQDELEYVYEKGLKVLPTFGVIPCAATFGTDPCHTQPLMPTSQIQGMRRDGTLHMDHKLELFAPIPLEGTLAVEKTIVGVHDRGAGKGAKIDIEITGRDQDGKLLLRNTMGYLNRWGGGFGGEPPPKNHWQAPDRDPDAATSGRFAENAPLLYRLTGDTYPLHVDPEIARKAKLERPIVHGLCSLGYACRLLIRKLFPGQPERLASIETQFRSVAMPGERFVLQVWNIESDTAAFRVLSEESGKAILDRGLVRWS